MSEHDDRFCERCGVSRDLHSDPDDPEPWDCYTASRKADLIVWFAA